MIAAMIHFSFLPPGPRRERGAEGDAGAGPDEAEAGGAGAAMPSKTAGEANRFGASAAWPRQNR
jgi:hypothetical protein